MKYRPNLTIRSNAELSDDEVEIMLEDVETFVTDAIAGLKHNLAAATAAHPGWGPFDIELEEDHGLNKY